MQRSAAESWRFEESSAQDLHFALFVRDALNLPVEPAADVPPLLSPEPSGKSHAMRSDLRSLAAPQWERWWRQLIAEGTSSTRILDPPGFLSLENTPALQVAAVAAFDDFTEWFNRPRPSRPRGQPPGNFRYENIKRAAEMTAAERAVPLSQVTAVAHVLHVQGTWSYQATGSALCSTDVAADADAASTFLRSAFASRL